MYLDETAQKMVLNLSKVVADQQEKIEELKSSRDTYQKWYKDAEAEIKELKNNVSDLATTISNLESSKDNETLTLKN